MALKDLGKNPISTDQPAGQDVRFDPDFEKVQSEIDKLSSPTLAAAIDWSLVAKLSQDILAHKSKDFQVGIYLCHALGVTEGLPGLASGVELLRSLLENFWDTMYPPRERPRARRNAVEWWRDRTLTRLASLPRQGWNNENTSHFLDDLNAVDRFLSDQLESAPSLKPLVKAVEDLLSRGGDDASGSPKETPRSTPLKASPAEHGQKDLANLDGLSLMNQGLDLLARAATAWMNQGEVNPLAFRLNRLVAWLPLQNLPPATQGRTALPPPDPQVSATLVQLHRNANWQDLLLAAESRVRQYLFWLDLSYYVVEAAESLGQTIIYQMVTTETLNLVERLSGLEQLAFSDGTPFANDETRIWLAALRKKATPEVPSSVETSALEQEIVAFQKKALERIKKKETGPVFNEIKVKMERAGSGRERLLWEMSFCHLLIQSKTTALLLPFLKEIYQTIADYRTEKWEPGLAFTALVVVLTGLRKLPPNEGVSGDLSKFTEEVVHRLSVLDPARTLEYI